MGENHLEPTEEKLRVSSWIGFNLRVVTIFTPSINEEDDDANGLIGEPDFDLTPSDKLAEIINDYNALYQIQHSARDSKAFYTYYKDISKRMKDRDRDPLDRFFKERW